jgi:hypothetical protein
MEVSGCRKECIQGVRAASGEIKGRGCGTITENSRARGVEPFR